MKARPSTGTQRAARVQFAFLLLLALALIPSGPSWSRKPLPRPCGNSPAQTRKIARQALKKARKVFPRIKLNKANKGHDWQTCECRSRRDSPNCYKKIITFENFRYKVDAADVHFIVGPAAKWSGKHFELYPFNSRKRARIVASQMRKDPVIKKAFANKPLHCSISWFGGCCSDHENKDGSAPRCTASNMGCYGESVVEFGTDSSIRSGPQDVVVTNFALPASRVPDDARGWALARELPEIKTWVAEHPNHWIILDTFHDTFLLVLTDDPKGKEGLTVVLVGDKDKPTEPSRVVRVRPREFLD